MPDSMQNGSFDIFGLGAALVDTEVVVEDAFLSQHGIDKGVMGLADEALQQKLLGELTEQSHHVKKASGGSACNTLVAAANLGAKTFYSAKVADDEDGAFFKHDLTQAGVAFHQSPPEPGVTGKCLVMVTPDAERTMQTYLGVNLELSDKEVDLNALQAASWCYLEGYLATDDSRTQLASNVAQKAKANGVKVAVSLSDPFVAQVFGDNLKAIIGDGVDLLFCNEQEAITYCGVNSLEEALEQLKQVAGSFAVTRGKAGALTFDGTSIVETPAVITDAVDTNGAGDMFAGAFLYGLINNRSYADSASLANAAASRVVSQYGPRLDAIEYDALRDEFDL